MSHEVSPATRIADTYKRTSNKTLINYSLFECRRSCYHISRPVFFILAHFYWLSNVRILRHSLQLQSLFHFLPSNIEGFFLNVSPSSDDQREKQLPTFYTPTWSS